MQTIILSQKMPPGYGGRPMRIGSLAIADEGRGPNGSSLGTFIGYTPDHKKVIVQDDLMEKILSTMGGTYKVRVNVEEIHEGISLTNLMVKLMPKKIKQEIIETQPLNA